MKASGLIEQHLKNRSPFTRSTHQHHNSNFSTIRKPYHAPDATASAGGDDAASPFYSRQFANQYTNKTNDGCAAPSIAGASGHLDSINHREAVDLVSKGKMSEVSLNQSIYSNNTKIRISKNTS